MGRKPIRYLKILQWGIVVAIFVFFALEPGPGVIAAVFGKLLAHAQPVRFSIFDQHV
jgi:hypothetical protein